MSNKTAYAEPVPIGVEAVETATVPVKEKKDGDDGDGYSASDSGSHEEEETYEEPPEETDKGDVEIMEGCSCTSLPMQKTLASQT